MFMKKLFARLLGLNPEQKIQVVVKDPTLLRVSEWRGDKDLCSTARNVLMTPDLRLMLQVVLNEHPAFIALTHGTPVEERAIWQARAEGYGLALANLQSLSKFEEAREPLVEDFSQIE